MPRYEHVLLKKEGRMAILTLNRPDKMNTFMPNQFIAAEPRINEKR